MPPCRQCWDCEVAIGADQVALRWPTPLKASAAAGKFWDGAAKGIYHSQPALAAVYKDDPIFTAQPTDPTLLAADTTLLDNSDGKDT